MLTHTRKGSSCSNNNFLTGINKQNKTFQGTNRNQCRNRVMERFLKEGYRWQQNRVNLKIGNAVTGKNLAGPRGVNRSKQAESRTECSA